MKIFVSALEPSANVHLKNLIAKIYERAEKSKKHIEICGIFDRGFFLEDFAKILNAPIFAPQEFSAMGFFDVAKKIFFFHRALKIAAKTAQNADVCVVLDASSFHLRLAKMLKNSPKNPKKIYYILPQIWAWKAWRAREILENFDFLCAILPFEGAVYENFLKKSGENPKNFIFHDVNSFFAQKNMRPDPERPHFARLCYVGHPFLDSDFSQKFPQNPQNLVFMPGSRRGEISRIFPIFQDLARKSELKKFTKILVVPQSLSRENLTEIYGDHSDFCVTFDAPEALKTAHFAFICSGSATLEATLFSTPFILCYIAPALDFFIMKRALNTAYIGLANIFLEKIAPDPKNFKNFPLHPEIIQKNCTSENLLAAFLSYDFVKFYENAPKISKYLRHGSAENVAKIALDCYNF